MLQEFDFTFDLKPNSCNIYFIPESDLNLKGLETEIVRQGRLEKKGSDEVNCVGFQLSEPCGILIESLQSSCGGRFEVRDQNGNMALVVSLEMKRKCLITSIRCVFSLLPLHKKNLIFNFFCLLLACSLSKVVSKVYKDLYTFLSF